MLIAHAVGASFVEAAITALGVAYLQKSRPDLLLKPGQTLAADAERAAARRSVWPVAAIVAGVVLPIVLVAGLVSGHGQVNRLFGFDWSQVDWRDVGKLVLMILGANIVILPLAYVVKPGEITQNCRGTRCYRFVDACWAGSTGGGFWRVRPSAGRSWTARNCLCSRRPQQIWSRLPRALACLSAPLYQPGCAGERPSLRLHAFGVSRNRPGCF